MPENKFTVPQKGRVALVVTDPQNDAYSPGPPDAPTPSTPLPNAVRLYEDIARLKLNVTTIAPIHGRGAVPAAELRKFIGRG